MNQNNSSQNSADSVIVALCSPPGRGAVSLIRASGPKADELVDRCSKLAGKKSLRTEATHTIHFGQILAKDGKVVDHVLFMLMRAPKSFTGQDTVEITCHGNPLIVTQIIEVLLEAGAALAGPGEFTKRAFFNKKLDLIQAEAIQELVMADSHFSLDQSMRKLSSGFSSEIEKLEKFIIELISILEASFEFLEEEERDVDFPALTQEKFNELMHESKKLKKCLQNASKISGGIKITILGCPNAGKSTLFNALVGHARAIVSKTAGTTRDSIESQICRKSQLWSLFDTAGIRKTSKSVEAEGIARAFDLAAQADLILLAFDPSKPAGPQLELFEKLEKDFKAKIMPILTKSDLLAGKSDKFDKKIKFEARVSGKTGQGLEALEAKIEEKIKKLFEQDSSNYSLNERQKLIILQFLSQLDELEAKFKNCVPAELLIIDLQKMAEGLWALSGKNLHEKVLGQIFSSFCVGK